MTEALDARTTPVTIRVSRSEKQSIVAKATAAGLPVSTYLRVATDGYAEQLALQKAVQEFAKSELKLDVRIGESVFDG